MKKVISLILCVAMMGLCIFPVVAKEGSDIAVDLIIGGASNLLQSESEKLLASEAVARKGDVNYDGKVTAVDARLCLQAVASPDYGISSLLPQSNAADVNNDGKVTAVDARIMLQDVAGMTEIITYAQAEMGGSLVVGPLRAAENTEYYWQLDVDKSELGFFDRIFDSSTSESADGLINQYFTFTPEHAGKYTINFKFAKADMKDVQDNFIVVLTVIDNK
jgi:hypothetical protein